MSRFRIIRKKRILRTGIVLTPAIILAIGYITFNESTFPSFPSWCFKTDSHSTMGFSLLNAEWYADLSELHLGTCSTIKVWHSEKKLEGTRFEYLKDVSRFEYRGATLYNTEHLGEAEFGGVATRLKTWQNEEVWTFYVRLLESWSYIIGASLLGLACLWICLAALDWVLAA
jgi:hypothetical protein